jgi:hypothetical protein
MGNWLIASTVTMSIHLDSPKGKTTWHDALSLEGAFNRVTQPKIVCVALQCNTAICLPKYKHAWSITTRKINFNHLVLNHHDQSLLQKLTLRVRITEHRHRQSFWRQPRCFRRAIRSTCVETPLIKSMICRGQFRPQVVRVSNIKDYYIHFGHLNSCLFQFCRLEPSEKPLTTVSEVKIEWFW